MIGEGMTDHMIKEAAESGGKQPGREWKWLPAQLIHPGGGTLVHTQRWGRQGRSQKTLLQNTSRPDGLYFVYIFKSLFQFPFGIVK